MPAEPGTKSDGSRHQNAWLVRGEFTTVDQGSRLLRSAIGFGAGSELRRPLGFAMVGGLALSQILTLYTTPVIYLYLDRLQHWLMPSRTRMPALAAKMGEAD